MSDPISFARSRELLAQAAAAYSRVKTERVLLRNSVGRIVAGDYQSAESLPAFDTSAMDGFAVNASDTRSATPSTPITFVVRGSLAAGDAFRPHESTNVPHAAGPSAWEIMTGAGFPPGTDACIKLEDVKLNSESGGHVESFTIDTPVSPGNNRRLAGEDFKVASPLLKRFHKIRAEDVLVLASLGVTELDVFKRLRIGLIATGKELVEHELAPTPPQIRNSTSVYLQTALTTLGAECEFLGSIGDNESLFHQKINRCVSENFDLILTTGAISVGKYDFVAKCLEAHGLETVFQKVKIRPGKPLLFGRLKNGPFVIGLPGNPVATATGFRFFVDPFLRALDGQPNEIAFKIPLKTATKKAAGTTCFLKARLTQDSSCDPSVEPHGNQKASITHPLLTANAWIVLDQDSAEEVPAGTLVTVYAFT